LPPGDDLLHYLPSAMKKPLNRGQFAELRAGEMATVIAEVRNSDPVPHPPHAHLSAQPSDRAPPS